MSLINVLKIIGIVSQSLLLRPPVQYQYCQNNQRMFCMSNNDILFATGISIAGLSVVIGTFLFLTRDIVPYNNPNLRTRK